ncbi:hypothetical protein MIR68_006418 [Amoeboaphelidium protococcarum]|nr:hypothetical protein MIR68_006418 [Amoeboaphelidium protococcarum]
MAVMELPTLVLSLGHVWKSLRNDKIFGFTFFSTRILFHGCMIYKFYNLKLPIDGPWWLIVAGIYPLHLYWFNGWVRQQTRLVTKVKQQSGEALYQQKHISGAENKVLANGGEKTRSDEMLYDGVIFEQEEIQQTNLL